MPAPGGAGIGAPRHLALRGWAGSASGTGRLWPGYEQSIRVGHAVPEPGSGEARVDLGDLLAPVASIIVLASAMVLATADPSTGRGTPEVTPGYGPPGASIEDKKKESDARGGLRVRLDRLGEDPASRAGPRGPAALQRAARQQRRRFGRERAHNMPGQDVLGEAQKGEP